MTKLPASRYHTPEEVPMLENYPPLKAWLDKHSARCQWQVDRNEEIRSHDVRIEQWLVDGAIVIIILRACQRGWDIFTACPSLSIEATFLDAEKRIGIES